MGSRCATTFIVRKLVGIGRHDVARDRECQIVSSRSIMTPSADRERSDRRR